MLTIFTFNFTRLCEEYEKIAEKALTSPANTEHLMELKVTNFTAACSSFFIF